MTIHKCMCCYESMETRIHGPSKKKDKKFKISNHNSEINLIEYSWFLFYIGYIWTSVLVQNTNARIETRVKKRPFKKMRRKKKRSLQFIEEANANNKILQLK